MVMRQAEDLSFVCPYRLLFGGLATQPAADTSSGIACDNWGRLPRLPAYLISSWAGGHESKKASVHC